MNNFFKSSWSFALSSVIKTQNAHQAKVNPEVASLLDSYDLVPHTKTNFAVLKCLKNSQCLISDFSRFVLFQ